MLRAATCCILTDGVEEAVAPRFVPNKLLMSLVY